jgi:hypothetical protein
LKRRAHDKDSMVEVERCLVSHAKVWGLGDCRRNIKKYSIAAMKMHSRKFMQHSG